MLDKILYVVGKSDMALLLLQSVLNPLLMDRYYYRLLPFFRQFLFIPNKFITHKNILQQAGNTYCIWNIVHEKCIRINVLRGVCTIQNIVTHEHVFYAIDTMAHTWENIFIITNLPHPTMCNVRLQVVNIFFLLKFINRWHTRTEESYVPSHYGTENCESMYCQLVP